MVSVGGEWAEHGAGWDVGQMRIWGEAHSPTASPELTARSGAVSTQSSRVMGPLTGLI